MRHKFFIGSRGSALALWQAEFVKSRFQDIDPDTIFEIKVISTTGDQLVDISLSKIGDKGLFTRQIETELMRGEIDCAVHSLKDLQTLQPAGLTVGAVCERELPNDAFISSTCPSIELLPNRARVATGSLRRRSQLLNFRPDLEIIEIRGNVPSRLRKFDASGLDAMILAYAGLRRLGLNSRVTQIIPESLMLPATGQGAIGIETRTDDTQVLELVAKLDHGPTRTCITAERAFLGRLEGGCQVPIGALARLHDDQIMLEGMVGSLDGTLVFRDSITAASKDAGAAGIELAELLIGRGALELLAEARLGNRASGEPVL